MTRDPKKRKEWDNRNTRFIGVRLMNSTDADIIQYMDKKEEEGETKQGIIKRSLRKTMEDEGFLVIADSGESPEVDEREAEPLMAAEPEPEYRAGKNKS